MKILFAEDEMMGQVIMQSFLRKLLCEPTIVSDGSFLLYEYKKNHQKYDAIITDIHMPIMEGTEAAR